LVVEVEEEALIEAEMVEIVRFQAIMVLLH
jgi:hypothetical protein